MQTIRILLLFVSCVQSTDMISTYYDVKKSWLEAKTFCSDHGGVLASNITIIEQLNLTSEVWMGVYQTFTPWVALIGCFDLQNHTLNATLDIVKDYFECNILCPASKFEFFSIKRNKCFCFNVDSLSTLRNIEFNKCNCSNCSDTNFYIYKQNVDKDASGTDVLGLCMAAACIDNDRKLTTEKCSENYQVICDNERQLNSVETYLSYSDGASICETRGSFLKWFSNASDICKYKKLNQFWTNAQRQLETISVMRHGMDIQNVPSLCLVRYYNTSSGQMQFVPDCEEKRQFVCQFDPLGTYVTENTRRISTDPIGNISDTSPSEENILDVSGTIAGILVASTVIVVVVLILMIVLKRRRRHQPNTRNKINEEHSLNVTFRKEENNEETLYYEIDDNINVEPLSNVKYQKEFTNDESLYLEIGDENLQTRNIHEIASDITPADRMSAIGYTRNTYDNPQITVHSIIPKHADSDNLITVDVAATAPVSEYCLAKPVDDNEDREWVIVNSEYDLLNTARNMEEKSSHRVYDHLPTNVTPDSDPTYDHSNSYKPVSADGLYNE